MSSTLSIKEIEFIILKLPSRDFIIVQWLRLCAPKAGGPGLIPSQGTRPHTPHRRVHIPQRRPGVAKEINKSIKQTKTSHQTKTKQLQAQVTFNQQTLGKHSGKK